MFFSSLAFFSALNPETAGGDAHWPSTYYWRLLAPHLPFLDGCNLSESLFPFFSSSDYIYCLISLLHLTNKLSTHLFFPPFAFYRGRAHLTRTSYLSRRLICHRKQLKKGSPPFDFSKHSRCLQAPDRPLFLTGSAQRHRKPTQRSLSPARRIRRIKILAYSRQRRSEQFSYPAHIFCCILTRPACAVACFCDKLALSRHRKLAVYSSGPADSLAPPSASTRPRDQKASSWPPPRHPTCFLLNLTSSSLSNASILSSSRSRFLLRPKA